MVLYPLSEIQVICIFKEEDWKIFTVICSAEVNKDEFLRMVFDRLNETQIRQLEKISACQFIDTPSLGDNQPDDEDVFQFISESGGKFWFEPLSEGDSDNLRIRDNYLAGLSSPFNCGIVDNN
jgi:hypothetical protein